MGWCFQLSTRLHDMERWTTKINLWHKDLKKGTESRRKPPLLSHSSASLKKGDLERLLFLKVSSSLPSSLPLSLSIFPSFLPSLPSRAVRCHHPLPNGPRSVEIPPAVCAQISDSERGEERGVRRPLLFWNLELREKLCVTFHLCVPTHGRKWKRSKRKRQGRPLAILESTFLL